MMGVINLLFPVISHFLLGTQQKTSYKKLIINVIALILLIIGVILGIIVLYKYMTVLWGKRLALLIICLLFVLSSLILYGIGHRMKPKKERPSPDIFSSVLKAFNLGSKNDPFKDLLSNVTPKMLAGVFAAAVVVSYLMSNDKKDS